MKTTITQTAFHEAFERMGRDGQFSHAARVELFKWLEEIDAQGCGVESELDVIALCCHFAEFPDVLTAARESGFAGDEADAMDWLSDRSVVLEFPGGVLIENF